MTTPPLLVQYLTPRAPHPLAGLLVDDAVHELPRGWPTSVLALLDAWEQYAPALRDQRVADSPVVDDAALTTPVTFPRKVLCAGANYSSHMAEMGVAPPAEGTPPFFFLKPPTTTVVGPGAAVPLPAGDDPRLDWEAELVVVIGRRARRVPRERARSVVAGYTIADDLSARGRFARPGAAPPFDLDWLAQKGQDGSCPVGPGIAPVWSLPDIETKRMTLAVNGVRRQDTRLDDLVVGIDALVAAASELTTLEPGDLILTGTPAGVGLPRGTFLEAGDRVEVSIEGIGTLDHTIAPPTTSIG